MRNRTIPLGTRTLAVAAVACLAFAACSDDTTPAASGGDGSFVGLRGAAPVTLQSAADCDAVLEDFQAFAPDVLADRFFGFDFGFDMADETMAMPADADASGATAEAAPAPATTGTRTAEGTSDTNTQEEGIDEPDVVETDGDFVYLVDQDALVILDGETGEPVSRTSLGTYGAQLLLQGDRLLAITGGGYGIATPAVGMVDVDPATVGPVEEVAPDEELVDPDAIPTEPLPMPTVPPDFYPGTVIQLIDVSDRGAPAVVETTEIEGQHVSTRVVDGVARVVVSSWPEPRPVMESTLFQDPGALADRDDAVEAVSGVVADTTIEDWLPAYRTTTPDATSIEGPLVGCEDVFVPEVNAGVAETSVLRVDFADGFDPADTTTVVAEAGVVYASASTLYLAANRYVSVADQQRPVEEYSTALQAFDLRGDGPAAHLGAGQIPGHVLNQYSMSEHDGHLRVATTEGAPWGGSEDSQSGVRVLRLDGDQLVEVGAVTGLGVTETIQSVRFMGPVGYVVTFRQTDPLYVIDLSDPTAPTAVGELKIPGFSSYLHPIGEGRLVGIGRDADLDGRDQGLLVSLFDVSDPTAPRQMQTYTEADAWSAAGSDPKAFLWWAPESVLAIPIERYPVFAEPEPRPVEPEDPQGQEPTEPEIPQEIPREIEPEIVQEPEVGVAVLDVSDDAITERATVTHEGRYPLRALVVQGRLWSVFDGGVFVSNFANVTQGGFHGFR